MVLRFTLAECCLLLIALGLPGSLPAEEVVNAGRGGNSTRNLLQRIDRDVLALEPTVVVVMVGTNDALNSQKLVPIEEFRENLEILVKKITGAGAKPIFVTPPPFLRDALLARHEESAYGEISPAFRLAGVVDALSAVAQKHDFAVIDYHAVLEEQGIVNETADSLIRNLANSGVADGVHPTAAGYGKLAEMVFETIMAMKKAPGGLDTGRIVCFGDSITYGAGVKGAGTVEGETYPAVLARLLMEKR